MSLREAAASGDRAQTLTALRDDLAARLEACTSDQNFAVMGRLLTEVLTQIAAETGAPKEATALDELAAKRRRRSPRSADAARGAHPAGKADGRR